MMAGNGFLSAIRPGGKMSTDNEYPTVAEVVLACFDPAEAIRVLNEEPLVLMQMPTLGDY